MWKLSSRVTYPWTTQRQEQSPALASRPPALGSYLYCMQLLTKWSFQGEAQSSASSKPSSWATSECLVGLLPWSREQVPKITLHPLHCTAGFRSPSQTTEFHPSARRDLGTQKALISELSFWNWSLTLVGDRGSVCMDSSSFLKGWYLFIWICIDLSTFCSQ